MYSLMECGLGKRSGIAPSICFGEPKILDCAVTHIYVLVGDADTSMGETGAGYPVCIRSYFLFRPE